MVKIRTSKEARYRTKQINIIKIDGAITAHSTIQHDYSFVINPQEQIAHTVLNDSIYNFNANGSEPLVDFIKTTDSLKKHMVYSITKKGEIEDLINHQDISYDWKKFKENISSYELFSNAEPEMISKIIEVGDIEFNSKEILIENSNSNLFNKIIFSQYLTCDYNDFETEEFFTISHFFPQIKFVVSCETKKTLETQNQIKFKKVGKPIFVDLDKMIRLYESYYREKIGFKFTDYLYDFESDFSISKQDGLVDYATVTINERIKNNIQSQVLYELKRVEL